ncbi:MAG: DNA primase DnaG [Nanoarchaeota archaeon]|nr:DNA primase DnaG [Nanoarchaeota archaeon]
MAKVSPVSIKYMIHANLVAEGALEKPDVIGAIFGQTEGLLGSELEMRELQKEGKIGRIEVDLERSEKRTMGKIHIPTALDMSETALIAAAIETIERVGPSDAQIEIDRIEDVRGSKRDFIIERAKKLMGSLSSSTDSREISNQIKESTRTNSVGEYGDEKLPCGDLSGNEIIVVEGRADVLNLLRAGVNNVIGMNGTKLPSAIRELSTEKDITLFVDGDRGGKLIAQNVVDNAKVKWIAVAPDGKEVEELAGKEIIMNLRKRMPIDEFFSKFRMNNGFNGSKKEYTEERTSNGVIEKIELTSEDKRKLKELSGEIARSDKAILLNSSLEEDRRISIKALAPTLRKINNKPTIIVMDGTVTKSIVEAAEEVGVQVIVAKNFATTDTQIKLMSL